MSKKSNKKSSKKKLSKKPGASKAKSKKASPAKKKPVKKAAKKVVKSKTGAKQKSAKKPAKQVKKAVKKALPKKAAPKKAAKKVHMKPAAKKVSPITNVSKAPAPKTESKKLPATNGTPKATLQVGKADPKSGSKKTEDVAEGQEKPRVVKVVKQVKKSVQPVEIPRKSVVIDIKTGPEPAGRFELEYVVHASAQILFEFLTSPSGLSEWFCDDVNIRNGVYTFKWEENEQNARVVKLIEEKLVRFQWADKHDNSYFEFRVERDDLTNDISLIVVDFAETPEDKTSSTLLWNSQIDKLLHVLGAYF